jgi:Protein of unknown function (DUF3551)
MAAADAWLLAAKPKGVVCMISDRCRPLPKRTIAIALALAAVAAALDAQGTDAKADWRQLAPWCAYQGAAFGNYDCSFYTFEQCMVTARGLGGYCSPNPRVAYAPYPPPRRVRRPYQ